MWHDGDCAILQSGWEGFKHQRGIIYPVFFSFFIHAFHDLNYYIKNARNRCVEKKFTSNQKMTIKELTTFFKIKRNTLFYNKSILQK